MAKRKKIGELHSKLTLNSDGFRRGLRRARMSLAKFAKRIASAAISIGKFGLALAGAGAAGLALLVRQQMKAIDTLGKLSDMLNISTRDLAGLQHMANQLGVETSKLNQGLKLMARRVGEAATGTGEATEAFHILGLDIVKLQRMSAGEQFQEIANAISGVENASLQASIAADIFGRSGVDLLLMLRQGSAGIRKYTAEAERLGMAFSRIDAAKVEMANDAIDKLKKVISSLAGVVAVELAPIFKGIADAFTTDGPRIKAVADGIRQIFRDLSDEIARALDMLRNMADMFKGRGVFGPAFLQPFKNATANLADLTGSPVGMALLGAVKSTKMTGYLRAWSGQLAKIENEWVNDLIAGDNTGFSTVWRDRLRKARDIAEKLAREAGGPGTGVPYTIPELSPAGSPPRLNIGFRTPAELGLIGGSPNVAAFGRSSPLVQISRKQASDVEKILQLIKSIYTQNPVFAGIR